MPEKLFERNLRRLRERNAAWKERDRYKQERDELLLGLAERIDQGRWHRYKRERDDLLQALFLPLKDRQAMADRILGVDDSLREPPASEVHSRQGE